jgi:hypothetical protein
MNGGAVPRSPNVRARAGQALAPGDLAEPSITNSEISELLAIEARECVAPPTKIVPPRLAEGVALDGRSLATIPGAALVDGIAGHRTLSGENCSPLVAAPAAGCGSS